MLHANKGVVNRYADVEVFRKLGFPDTTFLPVFKLQHYDRDNTMDYLSSLTSPDVCNTQTKKIANIASFSL